MHKSFAMSLSLLVITSTSFPFPLADLKKIRTPHSTPDSPFGTCLRSIRLIFDFKVRAIKGEKKFIKIANKIIMKEIFIFSDMAFHEASHGYLLNTNPVTDVSQAFGILGMKMDIHLKTE